MDLTGCSSSEIFCSLAFIFISDLKLAFFGSNIFCIFCSEENLDVRLPLDGFCINNKKIFNMHGIGLAASFQSKHLAQFFLFINSETYSCCSTVGVPKLL